jgi:hypothetical protein
MLDHAEFRNASKHRKANGHACFRRYDPSKLPTRITEDPFFLRVCVAGVAVRCAYFITIFVEVLTAFGLA